MAYKTDIYIDAGTTFSTDIHLTDENGDIINLTGYTAISSFKKWYTSSNSYSFTVSINGNAGIVTLSLSPNTSLGINPGEYLYDVNTISSSNVISRIVEGVVYIRPAITEGAYTDMGNYE